MKDLDFDELDRAVNSLISGDGSTGNAEVPKDSVASGSTVDDLTNLPDAMSSTQQSSTPAIRRSGRFMDVVHPSSNMRSPTPKVSRQGMTVQPPANSSAAETESSNQPDSLNTDTPNSTQELPGQNEQPNDLSNKSDTTDPTRQEDDVLESPFLPNTQVEKRPLGTFSSNDPPLGENETTKTQASDPAAKTDDSPQPTEVEPGPSADDLLNENTKKERDKTVPLPRELQSDLLSVESNVVEDKNSSSQDGVPVNGETTSQAATVVSIPQQYQEQPSTSDQQSSPIYDVANHHQPIAHPAKKKHSLTWLWILLVILVVGGGIGIVVYLFDPFGLL